MRRVQEYFVDNGDRYGSALDKNLLVWYDIRLPNTRTSDCILIRRLTLPWKTKDWKDSRLC
jgi:hypothetical protein